MINTSKDKMQRRESAKVAAPEFRYFPFAGDGMSPTVIRARNQEEANQKYEDIKKSRQHLQKN